MIVVIGCGNPTRCDDGVGPAVIQALKHPKRRADMRDARLIDAGTDGMAAMFAARGCRSLIIVDACRSGSQPGAVFEVPGHELERSYAPALNLHDFRWDNALYAGRKIFREDFPADVTVLLVEAETVAFGLELSAPVAAAVAVVATRIEGLILARQQAAGLGL